MNSSTSTDGTDTQVYNVSNQTVIAKKKGNKSIVAIKKTNKSSSSSSQNSDRELDDTVSELKTKMTSDKS